MKKNAKKIVYSEPSDYIPRELRKEFKLGEFAEDAKKPKKATSTAKKKVKRK